MSVKNTSPKYIGCWNIRSQENHSNVSDTCFCTDSSCWVMHTHQVNTHPISCPYFLNTFQVSSYQKWTVMASPSPRVAISNWQHSDSQCQEAALRTGFLLLISNTENTSTRIMTTAQKYGDCVEKHNCRIYSPPLTTIQKNSCSNLLSDFPPTSNCQTCSSNCLGYSNPHICPLWSMTFLPTWKAILHKK